MLKVIQIQINNMSLVSQSPFIMCNLFSRQRLLSGIEKFLPALHAWHRLHIFPPVCDLFLLMERKCFSETERRCTAAADRGNTHQTDRRGGLNANISSPPGL